MTKFLRALVASLILTAPVLAQHVSVTDLNYGNGNVVTETSGAGVPTDVCTGLKTYTQTDATSGRNLWRCVSGHMKQLGPVSGTDYATPAAVTAASSAASAAQTTANAAVPSTQKGAANGVATLDASGKVPVAQIPNNLYGTALGYYLFGDGTGTTVSDSSGNGNDGTLIASHLPTWVQNGLNFNLNTQGVTLPPGVNAGQTFEIVACVDPLPTTGNGQSKTNQYPLFINNTLGLTGLNLLYTAGFPGLFALGTSAGGGTQTTTSQTFAGCHVYTYMLGTGAGNLDHLYIDGVQLTYTAQGASAGKQTGGNLTIGSSGISPYNTSGFLGTMYTLRILSGQLTSQQAAADAVILTAQAAARGVSLSPPQYLQNTPQLHAIGDSLTCSWNGTACSTSYSWASQLTLTNQPTYKITNWGIYGSLMQAMQASEPWRVSPYCKTNSGPSIAILFGGTNDTQYNTVSQTAQSAASMIQSLKAAGCETFITTILSRAGNSQVAGTPTNDSQKNGYNSLVAAQWKAWGAKGVIDFDDPNLSADGAYANTTYFLVDATHNTAVGEGRKAAVVSNALNYSYSQYSVSNPHIVTASGTLTSADAAVSMGTLSGAVALVLPDCTGPSGATYVISNPQSAQAVTIAGGSSQPINGLATAITIPANTTVTLTDVPNPRSTSGCHWTM